VPPAREREDAYGRARERSPERSVRERERDAPSRRERERDAPSRRERDDYREEHAAHDEEGPSERASGKGRAEKKQEEEEEEEEVQGEDDAAMMAMMGFGNFGTTKVRRLTRRSGTAAALTCELRRTRRSRATPRALPRSARSVPGAST
jgi:U4/U6.U5 tri-snRNP-associated protein 3